MVVLVEEVLEVELLLVRVVADVELVDDEMPERKGFLCDHGESENTNTC